MSLSNEPTPPPERPSYPEAEASWQEQETQDPAPLRILDKRWQLTEKLGEGGMGEVWLAKDLRTNMAGRKVAVKLIGESKRAPRSALRFERETFLQAGITHENIVTIHDAGIDNEEPFLVMEYLPGGSLQGAIAHGPLDWREAAEFIRQTLAGLHALHALGILHRDIKPDNILLTESRKIAKLSDFGLARPPENLKRLTRPGAGLGTAGYMAPEQGQGQADERSDLWSVTATFYALLTRRPPSTCPCPDVPNLPSEVAERIQRILRKGSAEKPDDRYQNAEECRLDIETLLASSQSSAPPPPPLQKIDSPAIARDEQKRWCAFLGLNECTWTNDRGLRFRLIPPGYFRMGPPGRAFREVAIPRPFWAAEFPITNRLIRAFLAAADASDADGMRPLRDDRGFAKRLRDGKGHDDAPAVEISAADVAVLCDWLSRDGRRYRLPTEAEWEYLARAGAAGPFWWPDGDDPRRYAVFAGSEPAVADLTRANAWGLIDVLGNVGEVTSSGFHCELSEAAERVAGSADDGRVMRGGSFQDRNIDDLRLWERQWVRADARKPFLGARLVCECP